MISKLLYGVYVVRKPTSVQITKNQNMFLYVYIRIDSQFTMRVVVQKLNEILTG